MILFFKLLVLTASLSAAVFTNDYCAMEKRHCGNEKHIGCDKNAFINMNSLYNLKLGTITTELKEMILDRINSYRRLVAIQHVNPASNMKLVKWNNEMEYLASQAVLKVNRTDFPCFKTDFNPESSSIHLGHRDFLSPTALITWIFDHQLNYIASSIKLTYIYSANITSIGCAFGIYKEQVDKMILKCVMNEPDKSFAQAYLHGTPCSHCLPQMCSERYPGLCEDIKVLPVGAKGEPGLSGKPGMNGIQGEKGNQGPIGPTGNVGPKGDIGLPGATGDIGIPGHSGLNGIQGLMGPAGNIGPKGDTGLPGATGDIGIPGNSGMNGINGEKGNQGPIGPTGNVGPKGDIGLPGATGDIGIPGNSGMNGINCEKGNQGPIGPAGVKGDSGVDGLVGAPGIDGKPGKNTESSYIFSENNPYFWFLYVLAAFGVIVALFGAFNGMKSNGLIPWYS